MGKYLLVGASSGLGRLCASKFADRGDEVYVIAREKKGEMRESFLVALLALFAALVEAAPVGARLALLQVEGAHHGMHCAADPRAMTFDATRAGREKLWPPAAVAARPTALARLRDVA